EQASAAGRRQRAPGPVPKSRRSRADGVVHLRRSGKRKGSPRIAGRRIERGEGAAIRGGDVAACDVVLIGVHRSGSWFRVPGSGFVLGSEFRVRSSGFGVRGSGFGVRGSGFGVRGSEFGVRGSGEPRTRTNPEPGTRNPEPGGGRPNPTRLLSHTHRPPSTSMTAPVMKLASSDARNTM